MISIRQLQFSYSSATLLDIPEVDFTLHQVHGIVGLNGAGKTTFFNLIARHLKQDGGHILFKGKAIRRIHSAYLETNNFFYNNITGIEYLRIFPQTNTSFNLEVLNSLFQLPLQELTSSYSTGMKKKLALLAILQQDRDIYILDEPFNGLDMESNKVVELVVSELCRKGKTVFISSHILAPLLDLCHQVHVLQEGTIRRSYSKEAFVSIESDLFDDFNARTAQLVRDSL